MFDYNLTFINGDKYWFVNDVMFRSNMFFITLSVNEFDNLIIE